MDVSDEQCQRAAPVIWELSWKGGALIGTVAARGSSSCKRNSISIKLSLISGTCMDECDSDRRSLEPELIVWP